MTYYDVAYRYEGGHLSKTAAVTTLRVTAESREEAIRLVEGVERQLADLGYAPAGSTLKVISVEERRR